MPRRDLNAYCGFVAPDGTFYHTGERGHIQWAWQWLQDHPIAGLDEQEAFSYQVSSYQCEDWLLDHRWLKIATSFYSPEEATDYLMPVTKTVGHATKRQKDHFLTIKHLMHPAYQDVVERGDL